MSPTAVPGIVTVTGDVGPVPVTDGGVNVTPSTSVPSSSVTVISTSAGLVCATSIIIFSPGVLLNLTH